MIQLVQDVFLSEYTLDLVQFLDLILVHYLYCYVHFVLLRLKFIHIILGSLCFDQFIENNFVFFTCIQIPLLLTIIDSFHYYFFRFTPAVLAD